MLAPEFCWFGKVKGGNFLLAFVVGVMNGSRIHLRLFVWEIVAPLIIIMYSPFLVL